MDEVTVLLRRELDEYMATHGALEEEGDGGSELDRIRYLWSSMAGRNFVVTVDTLLKWYSCKLEGSQFVQDGLWLVGDLLQNMLRGLDVAVPVEKQEKFDGVFTKVVRLTFKVLHDMTNAENGKSGDFFTFKAKVRMGKNDELYDLWAEVLGLLGKHAIRLIHLTMDEVVERLEHMPRDAYLQSFASVQLHLLNPYHTVQSPQSIAFLKAMLLFTNKPQKLATRLAALSVLAAILKRELNSLTIEGHLIYQNTKHAEWTSFISDAHAAVFKMCSKKREFKVIAVAWEVRVIVLMLANNDIFARYWKDDAMTLLRVYTQNKDVTSLSFVALFFNRLLLRHRASKFKIPAQKDIMEIINTVQAWCFSLSKHKISKIKLLVALLVDLTLDFASYNMRYCIEHHIRRLLLESESIFDERKLVGLQSLLAIFHQDLRKDAPSFGVEWDREALEENRSMLANTISNVLIECNTYFGGTGIKLTEYKNAIGLKTFELAVACTPYLYDKMSITDDQKMMILTRSCVHSMSSLRVVATEALHQIAANFLSTVVKGVFDYVMKMPFTRESFECALPIFLPLLNKIFAATENCNEETLKPIEAVCLYLLCGDSTYGRVEPLALLETIKHLRQRLKHVDTHMLNVIDVITGIDADLAIKIGLSKAEKLLALESGGVVKWLIHRLSTTLENRANLHWLYSMSLATLFSRVSDVCPELILLVWPNIYELSLKLEPTAPVLPNDCSVNLSQWRNCTIFACATAFIQENSPPTTADVSNLLRRACRFIKSLNLDQRKSAVLILSSAHASVCHLLLDYLAKFESDAFAEMKELVSRLPTSPTSKLSKRSSKHQIFTAKNLEVQLGLQWAMTYIYKSLLEHPERRNRIWEARTHLLKFIDQLHSQLTVDDSGVGQHCWREFIQISYCGIIESLMHQSNIACSLGKESIETDLSHITIEQRQTWFQTMSGWCGNLDCLSASKEVTVWAWVLPTENDDIRMEDGIAGSYLSLVRTHCVFSAMATLLIGPAFDLDLIFSWVDSCFALDLENIVSVAQQGLKLLLSCDNPAAISRCIDHCLIVTQNSIPRATSHYLHVIALVIEDLRVDFETSVGFPKLLHAGLLHFPSQDAITILSAVLREDEVVLDDGNQEGLSSDSLVHAIPNKIASHFQAMTTDVLLSILTFIPKCLNASLQAKLLDLCLLWVHGLPTTSNELGSFLSVLVRVTSELQSTAITRLWQEIAKCDIRLKALITYFYTFKTKEKITMAKSILWWIAPTSQDMERVTTTILTYSAELTDKSHILDSSCLTILFLSPVAARLGPSKLLMHHVTIYNMTLSILHGWIASHYSKSCLVWFLEDDLTLLVVQDGIGLIQMLTPRSSLGFKSLCTTLQAFLEQAQTQVPTITALQYLFESVCLSMNISDRHSWASICVDAFGYTSDSAQEKLHAQFSLQLYRLLDPPFSGDVCVHLMALLRRSLEDPDATSFVHEYLLTLTYITKGMPSSKLVLYPQLLWVAVALLTHSQRPHTIVESSTNSLQLSSLLLVQAIVTKPSFRQPIVQDMFLARRPTQWKTMTTTADCSIDVLLAVSQQIYSAETEPLVRSITRTLLFTSTSKLHCLVSTVLLLPKLLVEYSPNDAQDLGYLWRVQGNFALSAALSKHYNDNTQWLADLCPLLMQSMAEPEEEKLVVEILLTILMGRCSVLLSPTLAFLQGLVVSAPLLFWKRNATLLSCLTRLIRTTSASESSWPMLVKILSTLVPSE